MCWFSANISDGECRFHLLSLSHITLKWLSETTDLSLCCRQFTTFSARHRAVTSLSSPSWWWHNCPKEIGNIWNCVINMGQCVMFFFFFFLPVHPSSVTSQNVLTLVITPEQSRKPAGPRCFDGQFITHKAKVMLIVIEKMVYIRN